MSLITVKDWIEHLRQFPGDWPVSVSTRAGGPIAVEHRDVNGRPTIAVFGSNGGRFGENPLTDGEYAKQALSFVSGLKKGLAYTRIHGDHRLYSPDGGPLATNYGWHYDDRIIERMLREGLIKLTGAGWDTLVTLPGG